LDFGSAPGEYFESDQNNISRNFVSNNYIGISLYSASRYISNDISNNIVLNNHYGLWLYWGIDNKIYHNNFINNQIQAMDQCFPNTAHIFDNGYPSGGNYWSDYTGVDLFSGPYQNETGSDGIGDTPHTFPDFPGGQDRYPLMNPWTTTPTTHIWPMFQHDPQHTGRSEYRGPESIEVGWVSDLGLVNQSTRVMSNQPIIGPGGVVYFGVGEVGSNPWGRLYAFNPDGMIRWVFSDLTSPPLTPAVGLDGTIYVPTYSNGIYALNSEGTLKWRFYHDGMGCVSAITVGADDSLYFMVYVSTEPYKYRLYSLDSDGNEKWVAFGPRGGLTTPAIGRDGTVYAVWAGFITLTDEQQGVLRAYNPDGTLKWSQPLEYDASSPAVGPEGNIYVVAGTPGYFGTSRALYAFAQNGTKLWQSPWEYGSLFTPAITKNGTVIVADRWS
jgi:parallel beta-helix repeat protein